MNSTLRTSVQAGFTLVELLIVVIILAILAAIVVPQFASSTTDAQESALDANLSAMRSAVELFKVQHGNINPGGGAGSVGTPAIACTGGTPGAAVAGSAQAWMDHLLLPSDVTGGTCSVGDTTTFRFGPYLRKGIPADPITGLGAAVGGIVATDTGLPIVPGAATGGWAVDTRSGQIVMNSNAVDSKVKAYSTH